ncbi:PREDICTED: muscular LMNA-interacting protein, partial [Merops nubicus]|uniref:muscular LMNA-interacting protein n=1 Tax=Merops nubicus TaxID=57421 RepID=UPI0004F09D54
MDGVSCTEIPNANVMDASLCVQVTSQESGTKPLTFTFVPSIGRLPTHFEVVDVSKFLVTIPEAPKDLSNQEIINKSNTVSDELVLKSRARQDCVSAIHKDNTPAAFQSPGRNSSRGEMQENDLFKAEFILITDSGDEDEVATASNNVHQPSNGYGPISAQLLPTSHISPGTRVGKPAGDGHVPGAALAHGTADLQKHQQYKIKTSYKAFAAVPTNTLLMEQKALEEPAETASVTEGTALDTHSEMCSPAQLRQQTEELCAVIDQVLQDPLTMRRCESSPSFLQMSMESDGGKVSTTLQRAAGRETRYANLYKSAPVVTESQLTKPGVIRPVLVKGKSAQQKEEPYQPNPFKKYLEEISDQDTEQVINSEYLTSDTTVGISDWRSKSGRCSHQYDAKIRASSPLHPLSVSLTDRLYSGPFSHLSSKACDVHENPYSPYSRNSLYNK